MRFLEAREGEPQDSITQKDVDNKMLAGTRDDQRPRARTPNKILRLAADLGVDIAHVDGTGDDNQITEADVRRASEDSAKRLPDAAQLTDTTRAASGAPRTATGASADTLRTRNAGNPNNPSGGPPNAPSTSPKPTA
jgi:pyruvate/2-oxoglutarate dehydrogenase complex dihydrolipoamide acyltransferase (E2) component